MTRDELRELADRRGAEEVAHIEVGPELLADPGDDPHRGERVAAQIEERRRHRDLVESQHVGDDDGDRPFDGVGGRHHLDRLAPRRG